MALFRLLVLGTVLILRMGESTVVQIPDTDTEEPPNSSADDELLPNLGDDKIQSGIVLMNRGSVLVTGQDWIVVKEFNITDVAELVNEAKFLFPSIRSRLETIAGDRENTWGLQFFRDIINREIDVIEPIINKINEKIKIFENMLPRKDEESFQTNHRDKRALPLVAGLAINFGLGFMSGMGEELGNAKDLEHLNIAYESIVASRGQQQILAKKDALKLKFMGKSAEELQKEMRKLENEWIFLRDNQSRRRDTLNNAINATIEHFLLFDGVNDEDSKKLKNIEKEMSDLKMFMAEKLNKLNAGVETAKKDFSEIEKNVAKQFTIISDLHEQTNHNRRSIYNVRKVLGYAIVTWKSSQKQIAHKLNMVVNITSTMRMMEIRLLHIDTYLTSLLDSLDTIATGRLSPNLVSPIELVKILKEMEDKLPSNVFPLTPITEDAVYEYYTYATVYAVAIPDAIRVFIKLPLKETRGMFFLFEPYSLPFYHEDARVFLEIVEPSDFILASHDLQKVAEIKGSVLEDCKGKNNMYLCAPTFTIHEGKRCSLSLIKEDEEGIIQSCERSVVVPNFKSKWIRAEGGWIYSVPRTTSLTRVGINDSTQMDSISGTGFLKDLPHTFTYADDGTVLFPQDQLGGNGSSFFSENYLFVPVVPNLLLLNESSKIRNGAHDDIVTDLSKANMRDTEIVNLQNLLNHMSLIAAEPISSSSVLVFVLAVAIIVNYIALGIMFCPRTSKKVIASSKNNIELDENLQNN